MLVSIGEMWSHYAPKRHNVSPQSPCDLAKCKLSRPTRGPLRVVTKFVQAWANLHNLIRVSQKIHRELHTTMVELHGTTKL
jgi:hypothetical protein